MKKAAAVLILVLLWGGVCGIALAEGFDYQAMRDADRVVRYLKCGLGAHFDSGPIEGGSAVYDLERDLAFWVKDGTIHAVNARARQAAPELSQAPENITYDAVYEASCHSALAWEQRPDMIGMHGHGMKPEEVEKLEQVVKNRPDDIWARTVLLGFYQGKEFEDEECRRKREQHVLWLVEHAPEAAVVASPEAELDEYLNADAYAKAAKLMKEHVAKNPDNTRVLANAAQFLLFTEPDYSRDCLKKCIELDPENPRWHEKLAFVYSLHDDEQGLAESGSTAAAEATEAKERALELMDDGYGRTSLAAELAEEAFEAGDIDKAREYCADLLKNSENQDFWSRGIGVHTANTVLGRIALKDGDVAAAKKYLKASAQCGSPELMFDGPRLELADALLAQGEREAVIEFLEVFAKFWNKEIAGEWIAEIKAGKTPKLEAVDQFEQYYKAFEEEMLGPDWD